MLNITFELRITDNGRDEHQMFGVTATSMIEAQKAFHEYVKNLECWSLEHIHTN